MSPQVKVTPPPTPHSGAVQFQLSEEDPLLLIALRGLRETEPLFFQRTRQGNEKESSVSAAAGPAAVQTGRIRNQTVAAAWQP